MPMPERLERVVRRVCWALPQQRAVAVLRAF